MHLECLRQLELTTDDALLGDAITNLLHNAIQHAPPDSVIAVRAFDDGDHVVIEVSDQGPGVPCEDHARIFERFYRADAARSRAGGGFGIGLCIAKTSVERLGGVIELSDATVRGATFRIILPHSTTDS